MESSDGEEPVAQVRGLDVQEKPADVRASRVRAGMRLTRSMRPRTGREAVATTVPVGVMTDRVTIKLPTRVDTLGVSQRNAQAINRKSSHSPNSRFLSTVGTLSSSETSYCELAKSYFPCGRLTIAKGAL